MILNRGNDAYRIAIEYKLSKINSTEPMWFLYTKSRLKHRTNEPTSHFVYRWISPDMRRSCKPQICRLKLRHKTKRLIYKYYIVFARSTMWCLMCENGVGRQSMKLHNHSAHSQYTAPFNTGLSLNRYVFIRVYTPYSHTIDPYYFYTPISTPNAPTQFLDYFLFNFNRNS